MSHEEFQESAKFLFYISLFVIFQNIYDSVKIDDTDVYVKKDKLR